MTKQMKNSLIFTILSLAASAFNFLFYPVISHLLSAEQFGDIQVGVSFIMVAAALFTSLNTLALFLSASAQKETSKEASLQHVERLVATVSLVLAILVVIFAAPIKTFLNLEDSSLLYILALIFIINIPAATWVGALQGNGQFIASGWVGLTAAITKIVFSILFILLGWGAHGALIGMLCGFVIVLPLVKIFINKPLVSFKESAQLLRASDIRYFKKTQTPLYILAGMILVAVIANLDVTIAKIFLDPTTAGQYAQVSTAAKIPYFALVPIAIILFKSFIDAPYATKKSVLFFSGAALIGGLITYLLQDIVLGIVFGHNDSTGAFGYLVFAFSSYSITTLCVYALIARGMLRQILVTACLSLLLTSSLLVLMSTSALGISQAFAIGTGATMILFLMQLSRRV